MFEKEKSCLCLFESESSSRELLNSDSGFFDDANFLHRFIKNISKNHYMQTACATSKHILRHFNILLYEFILH